jgi:predicted esterase
MSARASCPRSRSSSPGGVPLGNITVAGFSKGGNMALLLATRPAVPPLNIVSLAGCGKLNLSRVYRDFLANDAAAMRGRLLSIYDKADRVAATCEEAADKAPGMTFTETTIETGKGHAAFYKANPVWLDLVANWAKLAGSASTN